MSVRHLSEKYIIRNHLRRNREILRLVNKGFLAAVDSICEKVVIHRGRGPILTQALKRRTELRIFVIAQLDFNSWNVLAEHAKELWSLTATNGVLEPVGRQVILDMKQVTKAELFLVDNVASWPLSHLPNITDLELTNSKSDPMRAFKVLTERTPKQLVRVRATGKWPQTDLTVPLRRLCKACPALAEIDFVFPQPLHSIEDVLKVMWIENVLKVLCTELAHRLRKLRLDLKSVGEDVCCWLSVNEPLKSCTKLEEFHLLGSLCAKDSPITTLPARVSSLSADLLLHIPDSFTIPALTTLVITSLTDVIYSKLMDRRLLSVLSPSLRTLHIFGIASNAANVPIFAMILTFPFVTDLAIHSPERFVGRAETCPPLVPLQVRKMFLMTWGFTHAAALFECCPLLEHLEFPCGQMNPTVMGRFCPNLRSVKDLAPTNYMLMKSDELEAFVKGCPLLETVTICLPYGDSALPICSLTNLFALRFRQQGQFTAAEAASLLQSLPLLRSLTITGATLGQDAVEAIADNGKGLRFLCFTDCYFRDDYSRLILLENLPYLATLRFAYASPIAMSSSLKVKYPQLELVSEEFE